MMAQKEKDIAELLTKCQYRYKDLSKRDLVATLSYFKELAVKIDKHVYSNGLAKDLVTLLGTIPVSFKNNRYNIPVQLFLSETHPYEPPLVYVRPTPDMSINVSQTVDSNGRVYLPALSEWKYPTSELYMLINFMTIKFSEQTPLYSKPAGGSAQPQQQLNRNNLQSASSNNISSATPYPTQQIGLPPYPIEAFRPSYPIPGSQIPGYPPQSGSQPPYPVMDPTIVGIPSYSPSTYNQNPYYPKTTQPVQPPQPLSQNNLYGQTRPPYPSGNTSTTALGSNSNSSIRPQVYTDDTIKPEHYRMSLISAVQDKIRLKFKDACEEKNAEIDSLRRIGNDLEQSKRNLQYLTTDAENECGNIEELTADLKIRSAHLNESINRQQLRDKADIEDAVVTPTPLYRQLLQLYAEETAIQDLIFYLGEGLAHQTVSLDNFLKQARFLSRKQFFLRATMQLAREKAGLSA